MRLKHTYQGWLLLILLLLTLALWPDQATPAALAQGDASLLFIENVGQFPGDEQSRFLVRMGSATLRLTQDALWLTLLETQPADRPAAAGGAASPTGLEPDAGPASGVHLKVSFAGANPQPRLEPFNPLDIRLSYFIGSDPMHWQSNVPTWGGVRYVDLYPGLDLEISAEKGQLVQRLIVRNSGDAAIAQESDLLGQVQLVVDGPAEISLEQGSRLRLATAAGDLTLSLPRLFDQTGRPLEIPTQPELAAAGLVTSPFGLETEIGDSLAFAAANGDGLDLIYATFLGGSQSDSAQAIAAGPDGSGYVVGLTLSTDFPVTPGAFDTNIPGDPGAIFRQAFVARLNPAGSNLIYATFLGGVDVESAEDVVVDAAGNAYVAGYTRFGGGFPTTPGAFDTTVDGVTDIFVTKLNPLGTALIYSTLIGGGNLEENPALALDEAGQVYLTGATLSTDFPVTPGAFDMDLGTGGDTFISDAFIAKLNADGSDLIYATYLGGNHADFGQAITFDETGSAYVTGVTWSDNFPATPGALDTSLGGQSDVFIAKLSPDGGSLEYATFLGGSDHDLSTGIAVDSMGQAYVVGDAWSVDFPTTPGAFDSGFDGNNDVFLVKLNPAGSSLIYATLIGGFGVEFSAGMAIDEFGSAYAAGYTVSSDFPTTIEGGFDQSCPGCPPPVSNTDTFVVKLNPSGAALTYGVLIGGGGLDNADGMALDEAGNVYVTGNTGSPNFPVTPGAFDTLNDEASGDMFVFKLAVGLEPGPEPPPALPSHTCAPTLLGEITVGDTPRGVAVDPERQRVYVANFDSDTVSVIDARTHNLVVHIGGVPSPNGLVYDPVNDIIWVTSFELDRLTPIRANNFELPPHTVVGDGPWGVAYDPVHNYVYVANSLGNSVSVVDAATHSVIATLNGPFNRPHHLAANPLNGKVYVANSGNNSVTVIAGTGISSVVQLWDSGRPYGIAVDETRDTIYVATIETNRIVAIGPLRGRPDQFLGWAAFQRGWNPNRRLPLRVIAVNPTLGPPFDGGHVWATTTTLDGSAASQTLLIPKGWSSYFHAPFPTNVGSHPLEGIAIDRVANRVYVTSGASPGRLTVIGDHASICTGVALADVSGDTDQITFDIFTIEQLSRADINGDDLIDLLDLAAIATAYDTNDPQADVNQDGWVDILDLTIVASNYGRRLINTGEE
jgi:YVTN family beta-propeller protein